MTRTLRCATGSASWRVIASDGTLHASLADVATAGKVVYPSLEPGARPASLLVRAVTSAGTADGAPFFLAFNYADATLPTDATAHLVSGSGQTFAQAGGDYETAENIWNVWVRNTVAGDLIVLTMRY